MTHELIFGISRADHVGITVPHKPPGALLSSGVGGAVGVITAIPSVIADHGQDHDTWAQAITREGGSLTASTTVTSGSAKLGEAIVKYGRDALAVVSDDTGTAAGVESGAAAAEVGAESGLEAGAAVGSVLPGAGTVAGAAVGALVGAGAGWAASKGIEELFHVF